MQKAWQVAQQVLNDGKRRFKLKGDEPAVAAALLGLSREVFDQWAEDLGKDPKHLRHSVLAVFSHPPALQRALQDGFPLRVVQRLEVGLRRERLTLEDVETALQKESREHRDSALRLLLVKSDYSEEWASRPVWLYPADPVAQKIEGLSLKVAQALIGLYSPPGGRVVDPMAGAGTVVRAAADMGRKAWGGDVEPKGPDVVKANIAELEKHLAGVKADLVLLHPPTFAVWGKGRKKSAGEPYFDYTDFLAELVGYALPVLKKGGHLALVARPPRVVPEKAQHWAFLGPLENVLSERERELKPVAYHLAVAQDGSEDWSVFVARKR